MVISPIRYKIKHFLTVYAPKNRASKDIVKTDRTKKNPQLQLGISKPFSVTDKLQYRKLARI